jgi:hypothetical protein
LPGSYQEIPSGLPPIRGIEYQINFILKASIPNQPVYRSNLEETKELQRQVEEVMLNRLYSKKYKSLCSSSVTCA